jgi:hypothetical protein
LAKSKIVDNQCVPLCSTRSVKNGTLAAPSGAKSPQIATVSFQAIKAAIANPVRSLRSG